MRQGRVELASVGVLVQGTQTEEWIQYANKTYEKWVYDAHMYQYGNLDHLDPVGYHPYFQSVGPEGLEHDFLAREEYAVHWSMYPAPNTYKLMNWNFNSVPDFAAVIEALKVLKTETVVTKVRGYAALVGTAFTKEYHDSLHGEIPEGETEYPHSIHFHPILKKMNTNDKEGDATAEVVGFVAGGVAWDASMKDLLPEGVSNIITVVENNCNQSFTFEIDGPKVSVLTSLWDGCNYRGVTRLLTSFVSIAPHLLLGPCRPISWVVETCTRRNMITCESMLI